MTLANRVAYNTIIQIVGKVVSTAVGLIAVAVMARYLGQTGFGEYTTIITFLSFFAILADFGLTLVTSQMISQPNAEQNKILNNLFGLRFLSAIIFLGAAPLAVFFFPYEQPIKMGVIIAAVSFIPPALNQILIGLFQKNLQMGRVSLTEVVGRFAFLGGVILSKKLNLGLTGIIMATVISSFINFFLLYLFSLKITIIKLSFDWKIWTLVIKKSWPLAITIFFNLVYLKADTLILSLVKSQAEVGIYGAAYKIIDVLVSIPFLFAGIVLPILTYAWAESDKGRFKNIFQKSFDVMVIAALPLVFGMQFVANDVMSLVGGAEFYSAGAVLKILIAASSIIFLGIIFSHAIIAIDRQRKIIGAYVFVSLTALAGYLIFIPRYSYFGAAWVTIYSEFAIATFSAGLIWKYTKFFPNFKIFLKSLAASTVMAAVIYLLPKQNLFITLSAATAIYAATLYIIGGFPSFQISPVKNSDF